MKTRHLGLFCHVDASVKSILPSSFMRPAALRLGVCLVFLFVSGELRADEFRFVDSNDSTSIQQIGNLRTIVTAANGFEANTVDIISANCATPTSVFVSAGVAAPPEPGAPGTVSDWARVGPEAIDRCPTYPQNTGYRIQFSSDVETQFLGMCSDFTLGCTATENGSSQEVFTIGWSDGTFDSIQIQSELDTPVPEPGTLVLFVSGLGSVLGLLRRKILSLV